MGDHCYICGVPMDQPNLPQTANCGGDCLACMADAGDPECITAMEKIHENQNPLPDRPSP